MASPQADAGTAAVFSVHLDVFEGPFELLLGLIAKHQLDVTAVALSQVTDEFLAHTRALGSSWDLGQATDFLVVAATLLDLKAARLLPSAEVDDEEDVALLEARDLLFARLLQYRAYKQAASRLGELLAGEALRYPRRVSLEPRFADVLPEVLLGLGAEQFAELAAQALRPRPRLEVEVGHVHGGTVSVREQTALLRDQLRRTGGGSFRMLTADCTGTLELVARFLGLLELYREGVVSFEQLEALGDLHVRWTGRSEAEPVTSAGAGGTGDGGGGHGGGGHGGGGHGGGGHGGGGDAGTGAALAGTSLDDSGQGRRDVPDTGGAGTEPAATSSGPSDEPGLVQVDDADPAAVGDAGSAEQRGERS